MNEEFKKFAMSKAYYLIAAWIAILGANAILMPIALDCGYWDFSILTLLATPFLIIVYGLLWFIWVKEQYTHRTQKQQTLP